MNKYKKHILKICVILLIISGIIIMSIMIQKNDMENKQHGAMWKDHLMRIHFVSYVLEHVTTDMKSIPVPIEHIDSKLRIAINSERLNNITIDLNDEINDVTFENYDLDYIIWWIYEELLGIVNNENQLSEDEYEELANTLNTFRDSLEEYWLGVSSENKNETMIETRKILLEILNEIQSVSNP